MSRAEFARVMPCLENASMKMNNMLMGIDKVKYWLEIAAYDFDTAKAMLKAGRWLYVGFMCHQVIEKTLKAYWCACRDDDPPYLHNHKRLADGAGLYKEMTEEQKNFINMLTPLNIEARYPSYKEGLAKSLNERVLRKLLTRQTNCNYG